MYLNPTLTIAIGLDLSPDPLVDLDQKLISHLKVRLDLTVVFKVVVIPTPENESHKIGRGTFNL